MYPYPQFSLPPQKKNKKSIKALKYFEVQKVFLLKHKLEN